MTLPIEAKCNYCDKTFFSAKEAITHAVICLADQVNLLRSERDAYKQALEKISKETLCEMGYCYGCEVGRCEGKNPTEAAITAQQALNAATSESQGQGAKEGGEHV